MTTAETHYNRAATYFRTFACALVSVLAAVFISVCISVPAFANEGADSPHNTFLTAGTISLTTQGDADNNTQ